MYLLDTNVVSELRKGSRANERVIAWNQAVADYDCFLSPVTLFELRLGALLKQRRDPVQGSSLLRWIDKLYAAFVDRILPLTEAHWQHCADLHVPDPRPLRDSLIATNALHHHLILVTRNINDFVGLPVATLNPWDC